MIDFYSIVFSFNSSHESCAFFYSISHYLTPNYASKWRRKNRALNTFSPLLFLCVRHIFIRQSDSNDVLRNESNIREATKKKTETREDDVYCVSDFVVVFNDSLVDDVYIICFYARLLQRYSGKLKLLRYRNQYREQRIDNDDDEECMALMISTHGNVSLIFFSRHFSLH